MEHFESLIPKNDKRAGTERAELGPKLDPQNACCGCEIPVRSLTKALINLSFNLLIAFVFKGKGLGTLYFDSV